MIPASARIKTYPVVDRYKWLWVWMGDPALADPAKIPDYHWFDDPNWGAKSDYLYANATGSSSTTTCSTSRISPSCMRRPSATWRWWSTRRPRAAHAARRAGDALDHRSAGPPAFVKIGGFTGNVDRWQIIDYTPPSYIRLDVGATPTGTGAPEGRRVGGIQMRNLNAMTPETETTTHYFWGQATTSSRRTRT